MQKTNLKCWDSARDIWNNIKEGGKTTFPYFHKYVLVELGINTAQFDPNKFPEELKTIKDFLYYMKKIGAAKIDASSSYGNRIFIKIENFIKHKPYTGAKHIRELINEMPAGEKFTIEECVDRYKRRFNEDISKQVITRYLRNIFLMKSINKELLKGIQAGAPPLRYVKKWYIPKSRESEIAYNHSRSKVKPFDKRITTTIIKETKGDKKDKTKSNLKNILNEEGYDINKRLKRGSRIDFANRLGVDPHIIEVKLRQIRKESGSKVQKTESSTENRDVQICLLNLGLLRKSNLEGVACKTINHNLQHKLPWGGAGMIIGTPTALCASDGATNNQIMTDNPAVATVLDSTTDINNPVSIIIGNAVNPEKARLKEQHWNSINYPNDLSVKVDRVDRDGFTMYVTAFVERYKPYPCKVILLTSGIWEFSRTTQQNFKKNGIEGNFNFEDPSKYLTSKYKNLHILAMTKGPYGFNIRYLHNGKNEIVELPKPKENLHDK